MSVRIGVDDHDGARTYACTGRRWRYKNARHVLERSRCLVIEIHNGWTSIDPDNDVQSARAVKVGNGAVCLGVTQVRRRPLEGSQFDSGTHDERRVGRTIAGCG